VRPLARDVKRKVGDDARDGTAALRELKSKWLLSLEMRHTTAVGANHGLPYLFARNACRQPILKTVSGQMSQYTLHRRLPSCTPLC
jgi:hypothetical protein